MASLAKRVLGSFLGAALLTTSAAACAEEGATATSTETAAATSSATAAQAPKLAVQYVGAQDLSLDGAQFVAANASRDKVAIVVWGGNRTIQQEAYNAALDLIDMGIPVAYVLAPDHNSLDGDAVMQVYAASTPRSDAHWGLNNADKVRDDIRNASVAAYREAFPQQVAALTIR